MLLAGNSNSRARSQGSDVRTQIEKNFYNIISVQFEMFLVISFNDCIPIINGSGCRFDVFEIFEDQ